MMLPLYRDPHFLFRFDESRIIARIHLEAVEAGCGVKVVRVDPKTLNEGEAIARAVVGSDGWVELPTPIIVHAGDAFLAIPDSTC